MLAALGAAGWYIHTRDWPSKPLREQGAGLESQLNQKLVEGGISDRLVLEQLRHERKRWMIVRWIETHREFAVKSDAQAEKLADSLTEVAEDRGFSTETDHVRDALVLDISRWGLRFQRMVFYTPRKTAALPVRSSKPQAAIVIDDVGYDRAPMAKFAAMGVALTFAVLPNAPHAAAIAEDAHQKKFAVMVHLPMQATDTQHNPPALDTLLVKMDKAEIQKRVNAQLARVPHAVGVNNHQGSAFTENAERMAWVLERIQAHHMYFLDSQTSAKSKGLVVAQKLGLPARANNTFLDNEDSLAGIERQLDKVMELALKHGETVAIGHYRRKFIIEALTNKIPEFRRKGIELVALPDLYR